MTRTEVSVFIDLPLITSINTYRLGGLKGKNICKQSVNIRVKCSKVIGVNRQDDVTKTSCKNEHDS